MKLNVKKQNWLKGPKWLWVIVNSIFGIVIEEVEMGIKSFRLNKSFINVIRENENSEYEDLTEEEKKIVKKFFDAQEEHDIFALKMIHLESSVQLTFYFILLLFSLYDEPLLDKNYRLSGITIKSRFISRGRQSVTLKRRQSQLNS